tara:strand:- start:562 stop:912 length:351 start_codon:yes stop_codon:yes gene_type:complete
MTITREYGTTIYSDNTISKVTKYHFDSLIELREFWQIGNEDNQDGKVKGVWMANLENLSITHTAYVSSNEYFEYIDSLDDDEELLHCIACKSFTFSKEKEQCSNCGSSMNLWSEEE